jgi:hypothetical protein
MKRGIYLKKWLRMIKLTFGVKDQSSSETEEMHSRIRNDG